MAIQTDAQGRPVQTPSGNTITTTASNIVSGASSTAVNAAAGTAGIIVGGAGALASGVVGSVVGATVAPVIEAAQKVDQVAQLIQNPTLGGALALLGQGFPPYANTLDQFASYNYIFSLSALTNFELNFPLSYRTVGPLVQIIKSGGTGGKKIPTIFETDGQREFFIDNVNIDTYVAPNSRSRHSNAMSISFDVTEPYSMGQFFHNLKTAALVAGHLNYLQAPFLLGVEFIGYDDEGNVREPFFAKRYIPFRFVGIDMAVNEGGAIYSCQAVPYNEIALSDNNNRTNTDTDIRGRSVGEVLMTGANSLCSVLNEASIRLQQSGQQFAADQYVISFPQGSAMSDAVGSVTTAGSVVEAGTTRQALYESLTGIAGGEIPPELDQKLQALSGVSVPQSALGEAIKAEASDATRWNNIGKSPIVKSFLDGGNMPFAEPVFVETENVSGQFQRGRVQMSDTNRRFTFKSGESIEEIIQEVILSSDFARRLTDQTPDAQGRVNWFRIETQVFNVTNPLAEGQLGRAPRVFVYRVVPFKVDSAKIEGPKANIFKTLIKQTQAVKAYNYIYTGQNKDIIDFDINFDIAFFTNLNNDRGQMGADSKKVDGTAEGDADAVLVTNQGGTGPDGNPTLNNSSGPNSGRRGGGARQHVENAVARMFNDAILNTDNDLINVTLKIHGDPFYIVDGGIGNYLGIENPLHSQITVDGAMNPRNGEVDVILSFRTPIDYDGDDGFVKYPFGGFLPVAMFSGVYQVITVNNVFNKGQFTQELDLVRKRGQELGSLKDIASSVGGLFSDAKAMVQGSVANILDRTEGNQQ